jgi:hypothetical protein
MEGERKIGGKEDEEKRWPFQTQYATVTSLAIKIRCDPRRQRPAQYWTCPRSRLFTPVRGSVSVARSRRARGDAEAQRMNCWPWEREQGQEEMGPRMKHGLGIGEGKKGSVEQEAAEESEGKKGRQRGTNPGGYPEGGSLDEGAGTPDADRAAACLGFVRSTKSGPTIVSTGQWPSRATCRVGRMRAAYPFRAASRVIGPVPFCTRGAP